jgi:hypothetical protein
LNVVGSERDCVCPFCFAPLGAAALEERLMFFVSNSVSTNSLGSPGFGLGSLVGKDGCRPGALGLCVCSKLPSRIGLPVDRLAPSEQN